MFYMCFFFFFFYRITDYVTATVTSPTPKATPLWLLTSASSGQWDRWWTVRVSPPKEPSTSTSSTSACVGDRWEEMKTHTHTSTKNTALLKVYVDELQRLFSVCSRSLSKGQLAMCTDNVTDLSVTDSQREKGEGANSVKTFICQSTIIPASGRGFHTALSSQSINLADTFLGERT